MWKVKKNMSGKVLNVLETINIKVAETLVGGSDMLNRDDESRRSVPSQEYILSSVYPNEDIQNKAMKYINEMDRKQGNSK